MDRLVAGLDGDARLDLMAGVAGACGAVGVVLARGPAGLALAWGDHRERQCLTRSESLVTRHGRFELLLFTRHGPTRVASAAPAVHAADESTTGDPASAGPGTRLARAVAPWVAAMVRAIDAVPDNLTRLRADGARLLRAIDRLGEAFLLVDADWRIRHVNPAFERLVGARSHTLVGRELWHAFPKLRGTGFEQDARATLADGYARVCEQYVPGLDRWFESRLYPWDEGLTILAADVTQRRMDQDSRALLECRLAERQRLEALGTLSSGIAHDFNNVLAIILGHATLLEDKLGEHSPLLPDLRRIELAGQRARDLVQRILAFARRSQEAQPASPLAPLVADSLTLLRAALPPQVALCTELAAEPMWTSASASEVHQLVANLCTNAWHALQGHAGQLFVHLARERQAGERAVAFGTLRPGPYARLTVRDTGCGMDEATLARIFEAFFTTKGEGQGTGLGLHLVGTIARRHGGAVDVQSAPGAGSTFTVWLPELEPAVAATPAAAAPQVHGAGERIAYVDDDSVVSVVVEHVLRRGGFEVVCFGQPVLALRALQEPGRFDCLVTDHGMPQMTGLELARHLRRLGSRLPVVLVSGLVDDSLRQQAAQCQVDTVLHKERTVEDLPAAVVRALRAHRAGTDMEDVLLAHRSTDVHTAQGHDKSSRQ
ncbi:MAG: response regulator [Burkholderiales bacterium]|nr:response regulator [Burkholderiales bacterium]